MFHGKDIVFPLLVTVLMALCPISFAKPLGVLLWSFFVKYPPVRFASRLYLTLTTDTPHIPSYLIGQLT